MHAAVARAHELAQGAPRALREDGEAQVHLLHAAVLGRPPGIALEEDEIERGRLEELQVKGGPVIARHGRGGQLRALTHLHPNGALAHLTHVHRAEVAQEVLPRDPKGAPPRAVLRPQKAPQFRRPLRRASGPRPSPLPAAPGVAQAQEAVAPGHAPHVEHGVGVAGLQAQGHGCLVVGAARRPREKTRLAEAQELSPQHAFIQGLRGPRGSLQAHLFAGRTRERGERLVARARFDGLVAAVGLGEGLLQEGHIELSPRSL
mmetsp:Transcript_8182/g.22529  ORF Transcript_8182/g.22529 Transcript_8182/m.22529 type:complete len:261 (-) Transcript_8182:828-1610(-)